MNRVTESLPKLAYYLEIDLVHTWDVAMQKRKGLTPKAVIAPLITVFLLATNPVLAGEIYKTVDENGTVIYSDTPPSDGESEILARRTQRTDPNYVAGVNERLAASRQATEDRRLDRVNQAENAQTSADEAEERTANCAKATQRLQQAETSRRIYEDLPDGERRYYSAQEQDEYKANARAAVDEWCN